MAKLAKPQKFLKKRENVIYDHVEYPYPGDRGDRPEGFFDPREDSGNYHKEWQKKRYEQEAMKLWLHLRNEVISGLQDKGFDVE